MAGIHIDNLAAEINRMMEEYAADVSSDMKREAKAVAQNTVKQLKQTSPVGKGSKKGHYKDGWSSKVISEDSSSLNITVFNKKKPGLTHLLEKGHVKRGGGRVAGSVHIAPAEQQAIKEYENKLKARLSK